jgi:hypothetical protein
MKLAWIDLRGIGHLTGCIFSIGMNICHLWYEPSYIGRVWIFGAVPGAAEGVRAGQRGGGGAAGARPGWRPAGGCAGPGLLAGCWAGIIPGRNLEARR